MNTTARTRAFLKVHPLFGAVFLVELLFVAALLAGSFRPLAEVSIPLESMTQSEDGTSVSQPVTLSSGGYRITVCYQAAFPEEPERTDGTAVATLDFSSAGNPAAVQSDAITLTDTFSTVTARLWVSTASTVSDLTLRVTETLAEGQTFALQSVTLTEQPVWRVTSLVGWLLLFAVADALLSLLFLGRTPRAPRCGWGVVLLLAGGIVLASLPYCADFLYTGHDLRFHCYRIWAAAQALADGQFPVRMFTDGFHGYGAATPLYYCDLFLYIPALLYNAFLPLQTCYQIYVLLVNTATMLLAYYSFARIGEHRLYGAVAAFAYTLCAYRLTNMMIRASVGEYTAMTFLPLVALGAWAIARHERPAARDWLPLGLGMAGIVQSHLLTTELAAIFLALFWICNLQVMVRPPRLLAALKAVLTAVGLTAWFLLPCMQTLNGQKIMISDVHPAPLQSTGTYLIQLLGFFGVSSGSSGAGTTGDMPLTLGLAGCLALGLALWCCLRRDCWQKTPDTQRRWLGLRGSLALCLLAMWMSTTSFPWDWLANKLPQKIVDILLKPQFSWRYLAVAVVLAGVISVLALRLTEELAPRLARGVAVALVAATLLYAGAFYRDYAYSKETITLISTETVTDFPYETMGYDYLPAGADLATFDRVQATTRDEDVTAVWLGQGNVECQNDTDSTAEVELPLLAYQHYTARDAATGELLPLTENEQHCLRVTLPAGYRGTVQVRYMPPFAWRIAELVTLATALGLAGWAVQEYRRRRRERIQEETVQEDFIHV